MQIVSIVVPVRNAEKYIASCLSALTTLDYSKDNLEIIVVDNGSTDSTPEIIRHYPVKMLVQENVNISQLRNKGAKVARGNILAFVDADCIVPKDWLKSALKLLEDAHVGAVGCWYSLPPNPTLVEKNWDVVTERRRKMIGDISWIPSGNLIMCRKNFEAIQGFREDLATSEDVDICERIHSLGLQVFSHPNLTVEHLGNAKTLREFIQKEKWRGEGVLQNFIYQFPRVRLNKALIFTIVTAAFLIDIIVALVNLALTGNPTWLFVSSGGLILVVFTMAAKTILSARRWNNVFMLAFLFLMYGVSRVLSIFSARVWKTPHDR